MAKKKLLWGLVIAFLLAACGAPKILTTAKTEAETFEAQGNFSQALAAWTCYFNATAIEAIAGADFAQAAKTARPRPAR